LTIEQKFNLKFPIVYVNKILNITENTKLFQRSWHL